MDEQSHLSRRERQIMDIIYARRAASATEVLEMLEDPPTRTSVRTILGILEAKGHVRHRKAGREFVYAPLRPRDRAGRSALRRVLATFFEGSFEKAVAAHLADRKAGLRDDELQRLSGMIAQARKRGI